MAGEREIGGIAARLAHAEAEIEKLRERSHRHASALGASTVLTGIVQDNRARIEALESYRGRLAWMIGAVSGFSAIVGAVAGQLARHLLE